MKDLVTLKSLNHAMTGIKFTTDSVSDSPISSQENSSPFLGGRSDHVESVRWRCRVQGLHAFIVSLFMVSQEVRLDLVETTPPTFRGKSEGGSRAPFSSTAHACHFATIRWNVWPGGGARAGTTEEASAFSGLFFHISLGERSGVPTSLPKER